MRFRVLGLSCALAAMLFVAPANALIIDTFDDAAAVTANSGTPTDSDSTAPGSFLGTGRDIQADWLSGANDVDAEIDSGGSGLLSLALGPDTLGSLHVDWNGIANVDLTDGGTQNGIGLGIDFDDLPATITLMVKDGSSNSGSSSTNTAGGIFAPTTEFLSFASFSGSVDFTDVVEISLWIDGIFPATDLQIDFIESVNVPEPATGLLVLGGLGLMAARRRS